MSSFPCKIIEADLDADIVTLQMEGDYTASAGQKYLCDAAAASAEPVAAPKGWRLVPVSPTKEMLLAGETDEYGTAIWWDLMLAAAPAAPVTVQPDLTQQTLDDVKAGIPARDAEIEALRKEIEALQAAPVKPYSLDLDPAGIRALAADAISGALALGYQGVNPPPNNEHWLAPFWEIGRESAAQAQPLDIQPIEITDSMALAFHNAITDGSVGQEDVDDIKTGLRAVFANILDMRPQAQQPVSGADGLAIELQGIAEAIRNGGGFWRSCSGCHESNDGMATGPFSKTLKCHLGVGCSECGGIGAIWDTTDYDAMADFMAAKDQQNVENTETVVCLCNASQGQDADKVDAERYQAWRDALITGKTAEDDFIRLVADSLPTSVGVSRRPTAAEWDAAIDAARKEQA